ncbi:universal stress protein [Halopenitus sp. H-Gu1]|uniref:universal stress protein n=1 Tax=Halopenitus sp. H-Gu1 TaxID=3242697 RepID=UPI00359E4A24
MDLSFDTIVLAIGPRDDDRLDDLARAVLQVAKPTGATVVLTHVFTGEQFSEIAEELDYPKATEEDVDVILDRHESVQYFEDVFDEHGVGYDVRGLVGDVSEKIIRTAEEREADRVVVSSRGRSPVGKAVFGSVSQSVLLDSPCPVTYVKPVDTTE